MGQVELENAEVSTFLHYMDIYLESASYCITLLLSFYFSFETRISLRIVQSYQQMVVMQLP